MALSGTFLSDYLLYCICFIGVIYTIRLLFYGLRAGYNAFCRFLNNAVYSSPAYCTVLEEIRDARRHIEKKLQAFKIKVYNQETWVLMFEFHSSAVPHIGDIINYRPIGSKVDRWLVCEIKDVVFPIDQCDSWVAQIEVVAKPLVDEGETKQ